MNILVTGGAGFIGSNFVGFLLNELPREDVSKLTVLDKFTYAGNRQNLTSFSSDYRFSLVEGDICDPVLLNNLLVGIDLVFNFAAESHVDNSIKTSQVFAESNVIGTVNLLEYARKNRVHKFVQISTDEVYGSISQGSWDESYPLRPNSPYSASKASGDLFCLSSFATYGQDICITRCSNNYGQRQHPEKLIPNFISRIIRGEKLPVYGDGKNIREWIHVDDHCEAIWLVGAKGRAGEIYNVGSSDSVSNLDLTYMLLKHFGLNDSSIDFVQDRMGHDKRYSLNTEKIERELGFFPKTRLEVGLQSTIEWYVENFDNWVLPLIQK